MHLDERHLKAIGYILEGKTRNEVAEAVGVHPTLIWQWRQDPVFAAKLEEQRKNISDNVRDLVTARLQQAAPEAILQVAALSTKANSEKVRLQASQDLLDRADFGAVIKHEHDHTLSLPPEMMEFAARVLKESGLVLDAERVEDVVPAEQPAEPILLQ